MAGINGVLFYRCVLFLADRNVAFMSLGLHGLHLHAIQKQPPGHFLGLAKSLGILKKCFSPQHREEDKMARSERGGTYCPNPCREPAITFVTARWRLLNPFSPPQRDSSL